MNCILHWFTWFWNLSKICFNHIFWNDVWIRRWQTVNHICSDINGRTTSTLKIHSFTHSWIANIFHKYFQIFDKVSIKTDRVPRFEQDECHQHCHSDGTQLVMGTRRWRVSCHVTQLVVHTRRWRVRVKPCWYCAGVQVFLWENKMGFQFARNKFWKVLVRTSPLPKGWWVPCYMCKYMM